MEFTNVTADGGVVKSVLREGKGDLIRSSGDIVTMRLVGRVKDANHHREFYR